MKKYGYLISGFVVLALITAIFITEHKGNYYKASTNEVHKLLLDSNIIINLVTITAHKEPILIIRLAENGEDSSFVALNAKAINIKPNELLNPENRNLYKDHSGIILLQSENLDLAAEAWVLLSRMGYKNIKIWNATLEDTFKHSFQSDSLAGLK
jgi:hypothetical protein